MERLQPNAYNEVRLRFVTSTCCVEGRKEIFYLTTHSTSFNEVLNTFYLQLYGVGHMVKDHSDRERGRKEGNVLFNDALN